jgi:hypothetical protein
MSAEKFATEVGHKEARTLLFEVADEFASEDHFGEWSDPVQFQFVPNEDGTVALWMRRVSS